MTIKNVYYAKVSKPKVFIGSVYYKMGLTRNYWIHYTKFAAWRRKF